MRTQNRCVAITFQKAEKMKEKEETEKKKTDKKTNSK